MSSRKKRRKKPAGQTGASTAAGETRRGAVDPGRADAEGVSVGRWTDVKKRPWISFPGPRGVEVALRVAMDREPYAEVVAHAKDSLHAEVCGVLVGEECEDEDGIFVHVTASIRGAAAKEGSSHVTYTHETWAAIHETLERDYPKLRIVGWYHSHPGFGVEFSEMDQFVQQNFFPGPAQVAMVTDPLGGEVAVLVNTSRGTEHIDRFWVDGREHRCQAPTADGLLPAATVGDAQVGEALQAVEARLNQALLALDDARGFFYRFVTTLGILVALGITAVVGYSIYSRYTSVAEPPRVRSWVPVPVQIGDEVVLLGVGVIEWQIPFRLNALEQALAMQRRLLLQQGVEGESPAPAPLPPVRRPPPDPPNEPPENAESPPDR